MCGPAAVSPIRARRVPGRRPLADTAIGPVSTERLSTHRSITASGALANSDPASLSNDTDRGSSLCSSSRAAASTTADSFLAVASAAASAIGSRVRGVTRSALCTKPTAL